MGVNYKGEATNEAFLFAGSPTGMFGKNMDRHDAVTDLVAALVTQIMTSVAMPLQAGDLVTNIAFCSGATAANTPTNWWVALYSSAATPALLAQSADQLTAAWAADVWKPVALATPQLITVPGIYYFALMVKATTVPTLMGAGVNARVGPSTGTGGAKTLAQNSGAALTTTAPGTIATPTIQGAVPICIWT